ncbi:MAG: THUMP domain-containing protein [Candidatus Woesearchaeota archaeon]
MKGLAICHKGIEDVASQEIEEIIDEVGFCEERAVVFNTTPEKLAKVTYMARSIRRTILLLGRAKISKKYDDTVSLLAKLIDEIKTDEWLKGKSRSPKTFKVVCKRIGEHDFGSQDVAEKVGELLLDKHNISSEGKKINKIKVTMLNPDIVIYVFINEKELYLGIDFSGLDLSKRDYKIFSTASSLNGAVAYALLRLAKLKHKDVMIDPFCGSGVIPIEAALYLKNKSVNFFRKDKLLFTRFADGSNNNHSMAFDINMNELSRYDKAFSPEFRIIAYDSQMNMMSATKKNAQIAGVNKVIDISRVDIEWLDTKLDKGNVDIIATHLPVASKNVSKGIVEKLYKEFFYQAEYILADKGTIGIIVEKDDVLKECLAKLKIDEKFKIIENRELMQGKMAMKIIILIRK